jgi:hypothetical protein
MEGMGKKPRWYDGIRLHSSLGYQSPAGYENNHRENIRRVTRSGGRGGSVAAACGCGR